MELDDLRRQWQQPAPADGPAPSPAELGALLARQAPGLVEKMRRNAWVEAGLTALITVAMPFCIAATRAPLYRLLEVALLLLGLITLYYFRNALKLLGRMARADGAVRGHLNLLCAGLRRLLLFYCRLTLAAGPLTIIGALGFLFGQELARSAPMRWGMMGLVALLAFALGILHYVATSKITRWYLQRLYGQHLDRLEASLRELDEPEPPATR